MNQYLIPTLLLAAASLAGAAVLRRAVRREYSSLLPWLHLWGVLCTVPAVVYLCLCVPGPEASLRLLEESGFEPGWELFAGAAGVLPGLLFDAVSERREKHRTDPLPLGLSPWLYRAILVAVLLLVVVIPYRFLFKAPAPAETPGEDVSLPSESSSDLLVETSSETSSETPVEASSAPPSSPAPAAD